MFTLTYSVLLKPLPHADPDRLMVIMEGVEHRASEGQMPAADCQDFREQNSSSESITAAEAWSPALTGIDPAQILQCPDEGEEYDSKRHDPGFEPKNTIAISLAPGGSVHSRPDLRANFTSKRSSDSAPCPACVQQAG